MRGTSGRGRKGGEDKEEMMKRKVKERKRRTGVSGNLRRGGEDQTENEDKKKEKRG